MKNIIKEFIDSTPKWIAQMEKMGTDKHCIVCGIVPDNIVKLVKAIEELQEKAWKYDQLNK